ncbi:MAG: hypothetical protein J5543_09020 [Bacteroidales bacterium]|nr:hypothetical protein [Bacteroidales bacterium]
MKKFFTLLMSAFALVSMASAQDTYIVTGDYNSWSLSENCITFVESDGGFAATAAEFTTGTWGFKIIKNPAVDGWTYQYGYNEPIATGKDYTLFWIEDGNGNNIYLGAENNNVTLHNVKFEFYPGSNNTLDYFRITADEEITVGDPGEKVDEYMMVGTWQGWSFENNPLKFEHQGDGVYTASIDEIYGDWKIVKNNSWTDALGGGGMDMQPGNTYNLYKGGDNTGFAAGVVLTNGKFTLTILEDGNATLLVEGSTSVQHSYGLVGGFQGWNTGTAAFLEEQADGSWTTDIDAFPGGQMFKVSIDKTWECFLAQDGPTQLSFGTPYTCSRGNNDNNFTIGEDGTNYNVHVVLVVAADEQSAELTITDKTSGLTLLKTGMTRSNVYNVMGQQFTAPQQGLNIIDGKIVIIK